MSGKPIGYQLPPGDAYEEDLCCEIVYYPDREEYRRALLGALTYLSTWRAWEEDDDKRGQDAARAWKNALEQTMECWNMACMEDLIAALEDLTESFQSHKDCCDDNITYLPVDPPTTEIDPGVGDDPTLYGETTVADWDEWLEHLCYQAHKYVDNLIDVALQLENAAYPAWIGIGLIAALLALLTFSGIGIPIAYGLAATVVGGLIVLGSGVLFGDAQTDLETARDNIVCALLQGNSLADAVETALSSGTVWDVFYSHIDYDAATAILYEGGYNDEYLETETRDDCFCEEPFDLHMDIGVTVDIYTTPPTYGYGKVDGGGGAWCPAGNHDARFFSFLSNHGRIESEVRWIAELAGEPADQPVDSATIVKVEIDYTCSANWEAQGGSGNIRVDYKDMTTETWPLETSAGAHVTTVYPNPAKEVEEDWLVTPWARCIEIYANLTGGGGHEMCLTRYQIWMQYTPS